jgi:hypothetical protein
MLGYDDPKWKELKGGYKVPYNPTVALQKLENGKTLLRPGMSSGKNYIIKVTLGRLRMPPCRILYAFTEINRTSIGIFMRWCQLLRSSGIEIQTPTFLIG